MWVKYAPVPGGLGAQMYDDVAGSGQTPTGKAHAAACKHVLRLFPGAKLAPGTKGSLEAVRKLNLQAL